MSHRGFCYNSLILTKGQCTLLRGIAILGIVLHNLAHTFPFAVKENEYTFSLGRTFLLNEYAHDIPATLPIQLLSFFGHYGVPIFVFLSGYGLVMKYERTDGKVSTASFLSYNYLKLFSRYQTIGYQKEKDRKMKNFIKQRNILQSQSIIKKNAKQRRQIYIDKLRREAEERRKEEEKRMELLGIA